MMPNDRLMIPPFFFHHTVSHVTIFHAHTKKKKWRQASILERESAWRSLKIERMKDKAAMRNGKFSLAGEGLSSSEILLKCHMAFIASPPIAATTEWIQKAQRMMKRRRRQTRDSDTRLVLLFLRVAFGFIWWLGKMCCLMLCDDIRVEGCRSRSLLIRRKRKFEKQLKFLDAYL